MTSAAKLCTSAFLIFLLPFLHTRGKAAPLSTSFYHQTCPTLLDVVLNATSAAMDFDPFDMAAILRLLFHDCIVRGCDASVFLKSTNGIPAERDAKGNLNLSGFDAIDFIKGQVESACPGVVSCSDVLALAARDAVVLMGGPSWAVPLGRRDGKISLASDVPTNLPTPHLNVSQLLSRFLMPKGLNLKDLVVLLGAHTIGFAHCPSFLERISYRATPDRIDPLMNTQLGQQLQAICKDPSSVNPLDVNTPDVFDHTFYGNLLKRTGVLFSDQMLASDFSTRRLVTTFANSQAQFFTAWVASIVKLSQIGVITGSAGEIRLQCDRVNTH